MIGLSCLGNFSMGELGNAQNLTINNLKAIFPLKFQKIDAGKFPCIIPGFAPPQLPNFVIPSFPLFGGIPPFPLFCFLPPFPGIPALSLPAIGIPLPPLPFLPPIPLPIPGFALPLLPLLPAFDLGSLNFLCGLIKFNLPILDPFAFLNKLINALNGLISALNDWLKFCKKNAEAINATQVPPENDPSISDQEVFDLPSSAVSDQGISVPNVINSEPLALTNANLSQPTAQINLDAINYNPNDPASDLALLLANDGQIPPDPSIINQVANILAPIGLAGDATQDLVQELMDSNNIPSAEGFIGFMPIAMDECLAQAKSIQDFINCLIGKKMIIDNANIKKQVYDVMTKVVGAERYGTGIDQGESLEEISGLETAIALNSAGVPFGDPGRNLLRITRDDIARAFFITQTSSPLTAEKIVSVLTKTGVIDTNGNNVTLARDLLVDLPDPLTPSSLEVILAPVTPGPAIRSLKAMCIAATQGITASSLVEINLARQQALLQSVKQFEGTTFVQKLANTTFAQFQRIFSDLPFTFPMSVYDLIPILAIEFEIDDRAWVELFASFVLPNQFLNINDLFVFLNTIAQAVSSKQSAIKAIQNCISVRQGDFIFDRFVNIIELTLNKYNIALPSNAIVNQQIANALKINNNFSYTDTIKVLGDQVFETSEELAFLLLATGLLVGSLRQNTTSTLDAVSFTDTLANPIKIALRSPSKIVGDILSTSIQITIYTRQSGSSGIVSKIRKVVEDGIATSGSAITVTTNDFTQVLEITILRIGGFLEGFEAIDNIEVMADYATTFSLEPRKIPSTLINIKS
jgi:hypothetical protein